MGDTMQLSRDVSNCSYMKNWDPSFVEENSTNSTRHTTCLLSQCSLGRPDYHSGTSALEMAQIGYHKGVYSAGNVSDIESVDTGEALKKAVGRMVVEASSTSEKAEALPANSYRALSDVIGMVLLIMLGVSIFVCLARFDFNFVLYLLGYHIVCHDAMYFRMALSAPEGLGRHHTSQSVVVWVASKKMLRSAEWFSAFLAATLVLDFSWIYLSGAVISGGWPSGAPVHMNGAAALHPGAETLLSFPSETDQTLWPRFFERFFYRLALAGSIFNSFAKVRPSKKEPDQMYCCVYVSLTQVLVIVLTVLWSLRQRKTGAGGV